MPLPPICWCDFISEFVLFVIKGPPFLDLLWPAVVLPAMPNSFWRSLEDFPIPAPDAFGPLAAAPNPASYDVKFIYGFAEPWSSDPAVPPPAPKLG